MTPADPDDPAVEYILGSLPKDERDTFAARLRDDPRLRAEVAAWERRLSPWLDEVRPETPSQEVWQSLKRRTGAQGPSSGPAWAALARSRQRWRIATAAASALAASLLAWIGLHGPAVPGGAMVAVVNRSGDLPALIVRVEPRSGVVRVRSVAAETPPGRALELWAIVGREKPRSLGLLPAQGAVTTLPAGGVTPSGEVTLAVSVEPPGGSPSGQPTGPVTYTGRLIPDAD